MRIASITMVGQFPEGIDIHVRNLKWALTENDHIYIITTHKIIEDFNFKNDDRVTYIAFKPIKENADNGFVYFWSEFASIVNKCKINPEWFLFMETDIWFTKKINFKKINKNEKKITSFLPKESYHEIFLNDKPYHGRVWEGAQLVHSNIIKRAIKSKIRFNAINLKNIKFLKDIGSITLNYGTNADMFDEFGLYCAFIEKTSIDYKTIAVHLRGPETISRKYKNFTKEIKQFYIDEFLKKNFYIDINLVICIYYIVGMWKKIDNIDLHKINPHGKQNLKKVYDSKPNWLTKEEKNRFNKLIEILFKKHVTLL